MTVAETMRNTEGKTKLPDGWRWARLGEVCQDTLAVRDPGRDPEHTFIYVDISSVDAKSKQIVGAKQLLGENAPSRARKVINTKDVIVATTRPNLNAVAMVPDSLNDQICSTGFCVLRAGTDLNPAYLYFFVQSFEFVKSLSNLVKGALYPAVTDNQVKAQPIPLPPTIAEQERIARILDEQMAVVEKARAAAWERMEAANALPAAYLRQVFPKPGQELPDGWKWVRLGEVCEFAYGSSLPEIGRNKGIIPVYGSNGVVGYHDEPVTQCPTLIIGRKGSIGEVNYSSGPCWPIDTTYYVDSSKTSCDLRYLFFLLKFMNLNALNKASGVPGLNRNDAYDQLIPFPPTLAEQERIAGILNEQMAAVEKTVQTLHQELETINALPAALLRQAFAGGM